jgi:toxin ParE1/3/4
MRFDLRVQPEAETEIAAAAGWYEERNRGLGLDFLAAVAAVLSSIRENPHQHQIVMRDFRRAQLTRFPYAIIYIVAGNRVLVMACFHGRRDPKRWQRRAP